MEKLQRNLGGLRGLERKPDAIFVLDTKKEHIAVTEANKLGIPVVAVVDTNVDPELVQYPIPGNDDAIRANSLLARVIADAVEEGRFIAAKRDPSSVPVTRTAEEEAAFANQQAEARHAAARAQADRDARLAAAREIPPPPVPASDHVEQEASPAPSRRPLSPWPLSPWPLSPWPLRPGRAAEPAAADRRRRTSPRPLRTSSRLDHRVLSHLHHDEETARSRWRSPPRTYKHCARRRVPG